jgi:hypothetical protein
MLELLCVCVCCEQCSEPLKSDCSCCTMIRVLNTVKIVFESFIRIPCQDHMRLISSNQKCQVSSNFFDIFQFLQIKKKFVTLQKTKKFNCEMQTTYTISDVEEVHRSYTKNLFVEYIQTSSAYDH